MYAIKAKRQMHKRSGPPQTVWQIRHDAQKYIDANKFLDYLRKFAYVIPTEDYKRIRQRALDGDIRGAGLELDELTESGDIL